MLEVVPGAAAPSGLFDIGGMEYVDEVSFGAAAGPGGGFLNDEIAGTTYEDDVDEISCGATTELDDVDELEVGLDVDEFVAELVVIGKVDVVIGYVVVVVVCDLAGQSLTVDGHCLMTMVSV